MLGLRKGVLVAGLAAWVGCTEQNTSGALPAAGSSSGGSGSGSAPPPSSRSSGSSSSAAAVSWGPGAETCTTAQVQGAPTIRLLTRTEYNNTVRDLLGDNTRPADTFPRESLTLGLDNHADFNRVTPVLVERQLTAAETVSAAAVQNAERLAVLMPCDPVVAGAAVCANTLVQGFGPAAFRRPLSTAESTALETLFVAAFDLYGTADAVRLTLQTLLQAPQFLYRVEEVAVGAGNAVPLTDGYAVASRLSYFLWASAPDNVLMEAAANGELATTAQVEAQARRMMLDPRAKDGLRNFFRQWLRTDTILGIQKDPAVFPEYVDALRQSWHAGVHAYVDEVLWNGSASLHEMLTGAFLMVDARMAPIYGQQIAPTRMTRVDTPGTRAGVLTQPGMMAMLALPNQNAPVRRGIIIREQLMCEHLDPPPPNLVITPPDPDPNLTTRERFAQHTRDGTCAGCHIRMDPVGFGFENFDGMGRHRTLENNRPVDASGEVAGVYEGFNELDTDFALEGPFDGPSELGAKLASSPQVQKCLIKQVFRYALGRVENNLADQCTLHGLHQTFGRSGGNIKELFVAVAISTAFRSAVAPREVP